MVASGRVAVPFWQTPGLSLRHGQTFAGHPAACAAGLATIAVLERESLLDRAQMLEGELYARLLSLSDHPLVATVRGGVGVLGGLELVPDRVAADTDLPRRVFDAVREHGAIIRPMASAVGVAPPLITTQRQLDQLLDAVRAGLDDVYRLS